MQYINSIPLVLLLSLAAGCIEKIHSEAPPVEAEKPAAARAKKIESKTEKPRPRPAPAPQKESVAAAVADKETDSCSIICLRSKDLRCSIGPDDCLTACKEMQDVPVCKAEMQEVVGCMVTKPPKDWECSEEGIAALKDGVCDDEQGRFMTCIMTATQ
jgi:hypothetical protein